MTSLGGILQWVLGIVASAAVLVGIGLAISYFNTPRDAEWDSFMVEESGRISFEARPDDTFRVPDVTGAAVYANVNYYTEGGEPPKGAILPRTPGWSWNLDPGDVEARAFTYRQGILRVDATLDPAYTEAKGFTVCLWTGGTGGENKLLACRSPNQTWFDGLLERVKTLNFGGGRKRRGGGSDS